MDERDVSPRGYCAARAAGWRRRRPERGRAPVCQERVGDVAAAGGRHLRSGREGRGAGDLRPGGCGVGRAGGGPHRGQPHAGRTLRERQRYQGPDLPLRDWGGEPYRHRRHHHPRERQRPPLRPRRRQHHGRGVRHYGEPRLFATVEPVRPQGGGNCRTGAQRADRPDGGGGDADDCSAVLDRAEVRRRDRRHRLQGRVVGGRQRPLDGGRGRHRLDLHLLHPHGAHATDDLPLPRLGHQFGGRQRGLRERERNHTGVAGGDHLGIRRHRRESGDRGRRGR